MSAQGTTFYAGKKESDDPDTEDLLTWVALGVPRIDGNNYVRLSDLGFPEQKLFDWKPGRPYAEFVKERDALVRDFLSTVSDARARLIAKSYDHME